MKKLLTLARLLAPMAILSSAPSAFAAANPLEKYYGANALLQQGVRLGKKDLKASVAGLINVVLGFLGVIAVVIVLLGGFKWMTSQGSSEKIDEAKKLIGAGVVGLAIVLAAYAVANFVLVQLYNATNT